MTMDRRGFLYAGGLTAASASFATPAHAAASHGARSVADFGIVSSVDRDQTEALQKAVTELTNSGQPVIFPAGIYVAGVLDLPGQCTIIGVPGWTTLRLKQAPVNKDGELPGNFILSGIIFEAIKNHPTAPQLSLRNCEVNITHCWFEGWEKGGTALDLTQCHGTIDNLRMARYSGSGIVARQASLTIHGCRFEDCGSAIAVSSKGGTSVARNQFDKCGVAVAADGTSIVSGNILISARNFGLKLGSAKGSGQIVCQSNLIRDCRIGIGVSSSGDDIMCSLNMITGAKEGAIRAFDGEKLVGPDLARQSAEAYLNLMVAGNVVR
jgi:hypothetical protein